MLVFVWKGCGTCTFAFHVKASATMLLTGPLVERCMFVFCAHVGHVPVRTMPMSLSKVYALADNISQSPGLQFKGIRSWRRLIVNTPLSECLGSRQWHNLPGLMSALGRLGAARPVGERVNAGMWCGNRRSYYVHKTPTCIVGMCGVVLCRRQRERDWRC